MPEPARDESQSDIAILFADICGSTALFDALGDEGARGRITDCLQRLAAITEGEGGRVVKTIGDEIMCVFDTADAAANAACAMHEALDDGGPPPPLGVRVGLHFGPALHDADDVFGDAVNVAARMTSLAKAGQTLTTRESLLLMAPIMQASARHLDSTTVKGKAGPIDIYEILWDHNDVTRMSTDVVSRSVEDRTLEIVYADERIVLDAGRAQLVAGRSRSAELTVAESLASRHHVRFERRRGKFFLVDQSTNGTYIRANGHESFVRREEVPLTGHGEISLGRPFSDPGPIATIAYTVQGHARDDDS